MLIVALLFATFYSEYLNFYELVNNSANTRIAVRMNVLEMGRWGLGGSRGGGIFASLKKQKLRIRSCSLTDVVWQESLAD